MTSFFGQEKNRRHRCGWHAVCWSSSSLAVCRGKLLCHVDEKWKTCCRASPKAQSLPPHKAGGIWSKIAFRLTFFFFKVANPTIIDVSSKEWDGRKTWLWAVFETWQGIEFFNIGSWLVLAGLTFLEFAMDLQSLLAVWNLHFKFRYNWAILKKRITVKELQTWSFAFQPIIYSIWAGNNLHMRRFKISSVISWFCFSPHYITLQEGRGKSYPRNERKFSGKCSE